MKSFEKFFNLATVERLKVSGRCVVDAGQCQAIVTHINLSRDIKQPTENVFFLLSKLLSRQNSIFPAFSQKRVRKIFHFKRQSLFERPERMKKEKGKKSRSTVYITRLACSRRGKKRVKVLSRQKYEKKVCRFGSSSHGKGRASGECGGEKKRILNYEYKSEPRQISFPVCCVVAGLFCSSVVCLRTTTIIMQKLWLAWNKLKSDKFLGSLAFYNKKKAFKWHIFINYRDLWLGSESRLAGCTSHPTERYCCENRTPLSLEFSRL